MDIDIVYKETKGLLTPAEMDAHMAHEERMQAFWKFLPTSKLRNQAITVPSPLGEVVPIYVKQPSIRTFDQPFAPAPTDDAALGLPKRD